MMRGFHQIVALPVARKILILLLAMSVAGFTIHSPCRSALGVAPRTTARLFSHANNSNKSFNDWRASICTGLLSITLLSSFPALAFDPSVYQNDYSDPLHPLCQRKITVSGNTFHYSGTAVGPENDDSVPRGCSPAEIKEYGIRRGAFDGVIREDGKISAGDGIHEGIWEPANSASTSLGYEDLDGIRWNDGNKWTVKPPSMGESAGKGFFVVYVLFSLAAGAKELVERIRDWNQAAE